MTRHKFSEWKSDFFQRSTFEIAHYETAHKLQNLSFLWGKMNKNVIFSMHNVFAKSDFSTKNIFQNLTICKKLDSESDALQNFQFRI